ECFERSMSELVADGANDGSGHAAHDVRAIAPLADLAEDRGFLLFRYAGLQDNDHNVSGLLPGSPHEKAAGGNLRRVGFFPKVSAAADARHPASKSKTGWSMRWQIA